jgi:hypothetical protein
MDGNPYVLGVALHDLGRPQNVQMSSIPVLFPIPGRLPRERDGRPRPQRAGHGRAVVAARGPGAGADPGPRPGLSRSAGPGQPPTRPRVGADRVPGGTPEPEAGHPDVVGRHHTGRRPRPCRRLHRRVYAAMDRLLGRQDSIGAKLARAHLLDEATNPHRMALFDLSSSWVEGQHCTLAARGYSRDGGMIINARIDKLKELPVADGFAWLTCLRARRSPPWPHPTPSLRTHRRRHPRRPQVARTKTPNPNPTPQTAGQPGQACGT